MGDFAEAHIDDLSELLELPHGAPGHDTIRRVFDLLDSEAFHDSFMSFTEHLAEHNKEFIAIDGTRGCCF